MTSGSLPVSAILNPVAGQRDAVARWERIGATVRDRGLHVDTLRPDDASDAVRLAAQEAEKGHIVVAVGGDGVVRDVAGGVAVVGGTMAIIGCGRGNDLAATLGLPSTDGAIVEMLVNQRSRRIDVLDVNGHVVAGNAYVGVDAVAARIINRFRWVPALALYRLAGLAAVAGWRKTRFDLSYVDAGGDVHSMAIDAHDIVVANSGRYGNGLSIVPDAVLDDGMMDVLIVRHGSPLRIVSMLLAARRGTHVNRADVDVVRATRLELSADRAVPFGADGDEVTNLPATIRVRPGALGVVVA